MRRINEKKRKKKKSETKLYDAKDTGQDFSERQE